MKSTNYKNSKVEVVRNGLIFTDSGLKKTDNKVDKKNPLIFVF